jgi:hypothetical protein
MVSGAAGLGARRVRLYGEDLELPGVCRGDGGMPFDDLAPRGSELPAPMVAGPPYSFSVEAVSAIPQTELWGSDEQCGSDTSSGGPAVSSWEPSAWSFAGRQHSHLVMVWRGPNHVALRRGAGTKRDVNSVDNFVTAGRFRCPQAQSASNDFDGCLGLHRGELVWLQPQCCSR